MGAEPDSIGGVFAKLADDAGALVRAEVELYRAAALHRLALSRRAFIFIAVAALLAIAAVITLLVMLAMGLAVCIGPISAGLVVALGTLAIAALLGRYGANLLSEATDETKTKKEDAL